MPALLGGKRVLVIDDHATNVRVLTRQLQLWGMEVASADSGAQGLAWMQGAAQLPDVVITDMHMPEMDGVAVARALKAHARWKDIPIVLLSSGFMPAADESAQLFHARLLKPARQNQLFETLVRCMSPQGEGSGKSAAVAADTRKHVTVLVADDNAVNLKVACAMLFKLGYDILTATDGREAVEAVARAAAGGQRVGAILMDVNMPDVDGLQATRQIQAAWGDAVAAHHRPHGRGLRRRPAALRSRGHGRLPDQALARGGAGAGAGALDRAGPPRRAPPSRPPPRRRPHPKRR